MVLFTRSKGITLEYFIKYENKSLDEIIMILGKRFENHLKKSYFEKSLKNFKRLQNESLLNCISRLEYLLSSLFCDKSETERKLLMKEFMRTELKKLVHW